MSRIGKKTISIPESSSVNLDGNMIKVKGKLGELSLEFSNSFQIKIENNTINIEKIGNSKILNSEYGRLGSVINSMLIGVNSGWQKKLEMVGTGYRAKLEGQKLVMSLGYSHPIEIIPPAGISFIVEGQNIVIVSGIDKMLVGQIAANIRSSRPPEPYKGKGVKYAGEFVRRKAGKAAK